MLGKKGEDDDEAMLEGRDRSDLPEAAPLPPPLPSKKSQDNVRIAKFFDGISDKVNPELGNVIKAASPALVAVIRGFLFVWPYYKKGLLFCWRIYKMLPANAVQCVFGAALCFFGGTYVASIAAIEAFRQLGWEKVKDEVAIVSQQLHLVVEAQKLDDMKDDDGDGVADVDQIEATELAQRKLEVAMTAIKEPHRLQTACGALFTAYLAVLATLRLEFARTTAFALGIVEMVKFPVIRSLSPALASALGEDLAHWTRTLVETSLTLLAVIFAWWLQMIISAFYSGLRGGKMFAEGLIGVLEEHGLMSQVPFIAQPFDPDESYLDEAVGYSLAAVGFFFQFTNGFALPFPLNLIFLPLTIIEWFLRLQISMEGSKALSV